MKVVTLDFETYWSTTHSLTKMSPLKYVMHEDTQIISCSIKVDNARTRVVFGEDDIREEFRRIDWSDALVVGHNLSTFDALILAWRFNIQPKLWACTLAMARPLHAKTTGLSLAKLVDHYAPQLRAMGVSAIKDNRVLIRTQGRRLEQFTADELKDMERYNADDTDQCWGLFHILRKQYSAKELWHIDATIRMLVEPTIELDRGLLEMVLLKERSDKRAMLYKLDSLLRPDADFDEGFGEDVVVEKVRAQLASQPKFCAMLEQLGVEVPMKPSPTDPTKMVPALAKTDEAFLALQEHPDPMIALAANTRLSVKSTLLETRIEKFIETADTCDGVLPIPLHVYGADTTGRWSGWLYNPQNLPRIVPGQPKNTDALRNAMIAPPGHMIVVADLSGIELRVNLTLWQVPYAMELLQQDPEADLYKPLASDVLGVPIEGMPKMVRQAGKAMHLGCGFGLGSTKKYRAVAKQMARIDVTEEESAVHIQGYRAKHPEVVDGWKRCHAALPHILTGGRFDIDPWGLTYTEKGAIVLPSGRRIYYPELRNQRDAKGRTEWFYGAGRHVARIYAGKIDENIVQALARDVLADCAVEMFQQTKLRPKHTVHDELIYVVPTSEAQAALDTLQGIMRTPPAWWPELVTWSEGSLARSYGQAK